MTRKRKRTQQQDGNPIGRWWRALWLYGRRRWPFGLLMMAVTFAFAWWLFGLLTEPVGPQGPGWLVELPQWLQDLARWEHADKLAHAGLFGSMSVLALIGLFHLGLGSRLRVGLFTVLLVGLAFGAATEVVQSQVPTRHFDWWDIVADVAGSAIAVSLWLLVGYLVAGMWRPRHAEKKQRRRSREVRMLPIGLQSRFVPHPDVEVQPDPSAAKALPARGGAAGVNGGGGGLLLVQMQTGVAFRLNRTGEEIWPGIQAGESVGQLARRLAAIYPQAESRRLRHDTESLLRALWTNELVRPTDNGDDD